ncbi:hypothetical protein A6R68_10371 [Neotoma lepida]|uniref:Junctional adhesion molecule-like n=1 Tax=Neotoma lepida TaxID=56216 RepID=A0A1A6FX38_NEOLE|nr:hypothetical protein A6R68_10371 [Neotoma lepida]
MTVSSPELTVHVGDSVFMGCVVQSTEEKHVVKVDWTLSKGEYAESEYVLYYYSNLSVPTGRFQNRSHLVGDILRNDGSLLLQNVQEADQGTYTCEIRLESESMVSKKSVKLRVLPEEPKELTVHVGDSIPMRCVFQSTEKKHVTKVDWMFSSGKHAKEEVVWSYDFNMLSGYFQNQGRFRNRVDLMGDISRNDGSILLQTVKKSDQGIYTCRIYLGKLESRKTIELHVLFVPYSSVNSTAALKSLESKEKANPEKHVYSSITTWETMEEGPNGQSEATYMTMVRTILGP